MRVFISSRVGRTAIDALAGRVFLVSGRGTSCREDRAGVTAAHGDDVADSWAASVVRIFDVTAEMSMPTAAVASTAAGPTKSPGMDPAERTSMRSPARWERLAL